MSTVVYFKQPRPNTLDLEILKVQCWRSWFGPQTIPTEIVEALIDGVKLLHKEMARAKLNAEIFEAMYDKMHMDYNTCLETTKQNEALVALVDKKLMGLLRRMAQANVTPKDAYQARIIAMKIKEILGKT